MKFAYIYIYIYVEFLQNNNHKAVNKMKSLPDNCHFVKKIHDTQGFQINFMALNIYVCNIMTEGFRLMPLGLVRMRTFRLSTWVS